MGPPAARLHLLRAGRRMTGLRVLRRSRRVLPRAERAQHAAVGAAARRTVDVHWDPSRALPDSDPTRRDLFLSLGAFAEAVLIAAEEGGSRSSSSGHRSEGDTRHSRQHGVRDAVHADDLARRRTSRPVRTGATHARRAGDARSQIPGGASCTSSRARGGRAPYERGPSRLRDAAVVEELRAWLRLSARSAVRRRMD